MTLHRLVQSAVLCVFAASIAGTASAGSISAVRTDGPPWVYGPSDIITVDIVMDSVTDHVTAYGVHIQWTPGLSLVSVTSPGVGATFPGTDWQSLPGDETVDGIGLLLTKSDLVAPPAGGGVFGGISLATLQFHVTPGATPPFEAVTPFQDPVYDGINYYDFALENDVFTFYDTIGTEIVPEPGSALLLGLTVLGIGFAGRRR